MTDSIDDPGRTRRDFVATAALAATVSAVATTAGFPAILEGAAPLTRPRFPGERTP